MNTIYTYKVNRMCITIIDTLTSTALIRKHADIYYELRPITCSSWICIYSSFILNRATFSMQTTSLKLTFPLLWTVNTWIINYWNIIVSTYLDRRKLSVFFNIKYTDCYFETHEGVWRLVIENFKSNNVCVWCNILAYNIIIQCYTLIILMIDVSSIQWHDLIPLSTKKGLH